MDFGLIVDPYDWGRTAYLAQLAERHGFSSFWLPDSPMLFADVYMALTVVATSTARMQLGPCVTSPGTRHPSVTANAIVTLDEISEGRAVLGFGRGDSAARLTGGKPARLKELESQIQTLRRFMRTRRPRGPLVPILVAASGPRTLHFAGTVADGAIVTHGATPHLVAEAKAYAEAGLQGAGRNWQSFRFVLNVNCSLNPSDRAISAILPSVAAKVNYALVSAALPPHQSEDVGRLRGAYAYEEHQGLGAKHTHYVEPWMVERFAVVGTPERCAAHFQALAMVGVNEIIVDPGHVDIAQFISEFHQIVLTAGLS